MRDECSAADLILTLSSTTAAPLRKNMWPAGKWVMDNKRLPAIAEQPSR